MEILSPSDQVAAHLRKDILRGAWPHQLPGTPALAAELEVDRKTVIAALNHLEEEGLLAPQGHGKPRRVILPKDLPKHTLNICLVPYEDADRQRSYVLEMTNQIEQLGHRLRLASKNMPQLGINLKQVAKYVHDHPADGWLLFAASRDVLQWFVDAQIPAFAIFGRRRSVPIASVGPDKIPELQIAVKKLIELGHQRISMLVRPERRHPQPGRLEEAFLKALKTHGITPGSYHLPDWQDHPDSFHDCIDKLFQHTPPTALLFDESQFYFAAQQYLAGRGMTAPRDISLICGDGDPIFHWCRPTISHIQWSAKPVVKHTLRWVKQLSEGGDTLAQTIHTPATFIEGGTIGPVPR